ncbi:pirin family protein [Roseateles sp.]|jgi:redox-sensitive bicupin YhaK (pirin superfamily)|uniref:pirin family protein n=1 Tax=Roseateles sp. TaxID=1971397 RepID=UPI00391CB43B
MTATIERLSAHRGEVGGLPIARALPVPQRRAIGAWCFLDHAGPARSAKGQGMRVAPHPHTGLQTFSWMMEGAVLHRDSLGTVQLLQPGQVNLMTAGRGICHSEEAQTPEMHLAQLWIALPNSRRHDPAAFEHHPVLPRLERGGFACTLLVGELEGLRSPCTVHSPLMGLDLLSEVEDTAEIRLELRPSFEYGLMVTEGEVLLEPEGGPAEALQPGGLLYLAPGASTAALRARGRARALLLGGEPLADEEKPLLWWNFVGRSSEEIHQYAADWNAGAGHFGVVQGFEGERLLAPPVPPLRAPR